MGSFQKKQNTRFPRSQRLSGREIFRNLFRQGIQVRQEGVALCALANGRDQPRFACLVRRFAAAEASKRNRLKRLFREAFRKNQLIFLVGIDIAVVVSKVPEKISFVNVENIYLNLCHSIKLQLSSLLE